MLPASDALEDDITANGLRPTEADVDGYFGIVNMEVKVFVLALGKGCGKSKMLIQHVFADSVPQGLSYWHNSTLN